MEILVRVFAMQRQQLGWRSRKLYVTEGSTIADAWRALVAEHPVLAPATASIRFARNGAYADTSDRLDDGDELAIIPPVAGGAAERTGPYRRIELREQAFDDDLMAELRRTIPSTADGAFVVFVGQTRETPGTPAPGQEVEAADFAGKQVQKLAYEAFEPMAMSILGQIADEVATRFGVDRLAILHRTGEVSLGDASVVVAVAAEHRGAAFDVCRYIIDELKARAPIWKQERFADGSVWIGQPARPGPGRDA